MRSGSVHRMLLGLSRMERDSASTDRFLSSAMSAGSILLTPAARLIVPMNAMRSAHSRLATDAISHAPPRRTLSLA